MPGSQPDHKEPGPGGGEKRLREGRAQHTDFTHRIKWPLTLGALIGKECASWWGGGGRGSGLLTLELSL